MLRASTGYGDALEVWFLWCSSQCSVVESLPLSEALGPRPGSWGRPAASITGGALLCLQIPCLTPDRSPLLVTVAPY